MPFPVCLRRGLIAAAVLALAACTELTPQQPAPLLNYQPESFNASAFSRHFAAEPERTCEAARRALLSQGYVVISASADQVTVRKYFQPDPTHHVQLEFKVVCAPEAGRDKPVSVIFASGLKEQYVMRKAKNSASLGVGGIGSLSLPVEGSLDALIKVSSETVVDPQLYERFFDLVGAHLERAIVPPHASQTPPPPPPPAPPMPVFVLVPQPMTPPPAPNASQPNAQPAPQAPEGEPAAVAPPQPAASAPQPAVAEPRQPASAPQPAAAAS